MIKNDYSTNNDFLIKNTGFKLPDKCLICHKNSIDEDFKGFAVAIPCGHVSICISCLSNENYRNKCWINGCKKQHITYIPLKLKSLSPYKNA